MIKVETTVKKCYYCETSELVFELKHNGLFLQNAEINHNVLICPKCISPMLVENKCYICCRKHFWNEAFCLKELFSLEKFYLIKEYDAKLMQPIFKQGIHCLAHTNDFEKFSICVRNCENFHLLLGRI